MNPDLGSDSAQLLKMHCLNGAQSNADDMAFARMALRLRHIDGSFSGKEASAARVVLESGSGRERFLDSVPNTNRG